jgi:hypothetical protein
MTKLSRGYFDADFMAILVFTILFILFAINQTHAAVKIQKHARATSPGVRTVRLTSEMIAPIRITPGRSTVLSFPARPSKVILGNQGVFAVEYVDNDIAIAALSGRSSSDLFVYLEGRRFAFNLLSVASGGDSIVLVRDFVGEGSR